MYGSNYYASQYYRNQYYTGTSGDGVVLTGRYFDRLGQLGFVGTLDDRQKAYLQSLGFSGSMDDCVKQHLSNLGYTGSKNSCLLQKALIEQSNSISEMMRNQGLIPL
jgi:hypothetical protein